MNSKYPPFKGICKDNIDLVGYQDLVTVRYYYINTHTYTYPINTHTYHLSYTYIYPCCKDNIDLVGYQDLVTVR